MNDPYKMDVCWNSNNQEGVPAGSFKFWCDRDNEYIEYKNGDHIKFNYDREEGEQ